MRFTRATGISVLLAACGPSVLVETGAQDGGDGSAQTDDGAVTFGEPSPDPPDPVPPEPVGTTTSGGGVDSSDDGNPFIVDVDAGKIYECQLAGDDCPRGEKCVPYSMDGGSGWNATKCVPIHPDPVGLGDACEQELFNGSAWTGNDNCGDDAVCFDWDPDAPGVCKGLCDESEPECQEPGALPYVGCQSCFCICETPCDPLGNDCPNDTMCVVTSDIAICVPDASGDEGAYQDPCEFLNVCDPGLFCAASDWVPGCDTSTSGCCTPYCDTQAPSCPDGTTCEPLYEDGGAPETLELVGMCLAQP